jgi:hypothetical protein
MAVATTGLYTHIGIAINCHLRWPKWDDGANMSCCNVCFIMWPNIQHRQLACAPTSSTGVLCDI